MNRKRILTLVLVIVVIGALPKWIPVPSKATLISQKEANYGQIAEIKSEIAKAKVFALNSESLDLQITAINSAVPDGPDLPSLIDTIGKIAYESNLSWVAGSPQKVPGSDGLQDPVWTISVSLTGSGSSLPLFFDSLKKDSRIITVDSISYQTSASGEVNATAILRFYASSLTDDQRGTGK